MRIFHEKKNIKQEAEDRYKKMKPAKIIAEIGCNHQGEMKIAKQMIETAKYFCNVDVIKFQKRNPKECLTDEEYNSLHPVPYHSFGKTYGEHREFLEFTLEQHKELKADCERMGLVYSSSVWDLTSAKEIESLNPEYIKIPSPRNTHFEILEYLCENYRREIHISLGMTTRKEKEEIVNFFIKKRRNKDLVLYACTSAYPVPFEDVCLLEINRLQDKFSDCVKAIGFSGHHKGIAVDIAAFVLGAQYIERHFTLDRIWKGTDHSASLEPDGLRRVARDIKAVAKSIAYKKKEILDIEESQRKKLKYKKKRPQSIL